VAGIAAHRGEGPRAARLLAAAEELREQLGFVVPASERPLLDATTALLEAQLDADERAAAREQGRALSLPDAVTAALATQASSD
jgi:hypothetical protein